MESGFAGRTDGSPDPYLSYKFRVRIAGSSGPASQAAFARCSGIRAAMNYLPVLNGSGTASRIFIGASFSKVTLSKGVVSSDELMKWVFQSIPANGSGPMKSDVKTIEIAALDSEGKEGIVWTLYRAIPTAYEVPSLDAEGNTVLFENLELTFYGLTRENKKNG